MYWVRIELGTVLQTLCLNRQVVRDRLSEACYRLSGPCTGFTKFQALWFDSESPKL